MEISPADPPFSLRAREKKRNVNVVYIDTRGDNVKAIHLYKKMGFREFGRTIHFRKIID